MYRVCICVYKCIIPLQRLLSKQQQEGTSFPLVWPQGFLLSFWSDFPKGKEGRKRKD